MALSASADGVREVFLKASCSSGSAFSCRGRPVLSLTLRRLRSWPTPSGCEYSMPCRSLRNWSAWADGCDLPLLHGLLQVLEGFGRDQLLSAALAHPTLEKLLESALLVACEPSLALTPRVAQRLGGLPQVTAFLRLQEPEHPHPLEQVRVAMVLFELLELLGIFFDYP